MIVHPQIEYALITWDLSYNTDILGPNPRGNLIMGCKMGNNGLQYTWLAYCNVQTAIMAFNTRAALHYVSFHETRTIYLNYL